jgi:two-component system, LytTR family, sensor kinase
MDSNPRFFLLIVVVLVSGLILIAGLYLLANFNTLLRRWVRNDWLRKNVLAIVSAVCFSLALLPTNPEFYQAMPHARMLKYMGIQVTAVTAMTLVVFNVTRLILFTRYVRRMSFTRRMAVLLVTIMTCTMLMAIPINYWATQGTLKGVKLSMLGNFYVGCMCGMVYIAMSYVERQRQRKLNEKELELLKLRELKTKAELEALHSKINPHFLYNALNSIADLSVTDGRKARKMTVALADLFRFSINYSNHNYSSVKEEVEMAEVYLEIEKIRFEDQLNYSVDIDPEANHYLVPRFVLQPIVENAVKHGLKVTGRMTQIQLEIKKENGGLIMNVIDNGPRFPEELSPGYGVRSVYDKMELLFPNQFEILFQNEPRKQVSLHINKLIKNEPRV